MPGPHKSGIELFSVWLYLAVNVSASQASASVPAKAQPIVYGHSRQGRPLVAYVLGNGPDVTLITGGIHGNETSAPGVVEDLLAYLEASPDALNGREVILVPRVNPDGDAAHTRGDAAGVDLNRNFPYDWAPKRRNVRLSTGSMPLSEPESRALVALMDRYNPVRAVSIHQPLDCLISSGTLGHQIAVAMHERNGYKITDDVGYPTPGSFGGYCAHVRQMSGVTLELPWQSVKEGWSANKAALLAAIQFATPPMSSPALPQPQQ